MDPVTLGLLSLLALTVFLISGVRIAFATALCGFFGLWMLRGYDPAATLASTSIFGHLVNYNLLVLPLFIMMGLLRLSRRHHARSLLDGAAMVRPSARRAGHCHHHRLGRLCRRLRRLDRRRPR